jgi:outer membrane immunogenic protein
MRSAFLIGVAGLALTAAQAHAADVGEAEPFMTAPVVEAAPANDWSGFYLGALLGYSWGRAETDDPSEDLGADGIDGGAYAGATWQTGNFVLGGEADLLASGLAGEEDGLEVDQGLNGSLRARAGIALDQFLLYGTGGVALSDVEVGDGSSSDDSALWGWTAGAGVEAMVTDKVTARIEYRYTDYENETFTLDNGPVDSDLSTQSVRAGIGFKF